MPPRRTRDYHLDMGTVIRKDGGEEGKYQATYKAPGRRRPNSSPAPLSDSLGDRAILGVAQLKLSAFDCTFSPRIWHGSLVVAGLFLTPLLTSSAMSSLKQPIKLGRWFVRVCLRALTKPVPSTPRISFHSNPCMVYFGCRNYPISGQVRTSFTSGSIRFGIPLWQRRGARADGLGHD